MHKEMQVALFIILCIKTKKIKWTYLSSVFAHIFTTKTDWEVMLLLVSPIEDLVK